MSNIHSGDPGLHLDPIKINSFSELEKIFDQLRNSFDRAEAKMTEVRDALQVQPEPPVNQLRYAGYHLCQALASVSFNQLPTEISRRHITSVHKHCLRAYYDTFDFAFIFIFDKFENLVSKYTDAMLAIYEEFPTALELKLAIDNVIDIKRIKNNLENNELATKRVSREEYYKLIDEKIMKLLELYRLIPEMEKHYVVKIKQLEAQIDAQSKNDSLQRKSLWITILGLIISLLCSLAYIAFEDQIKDLTKKYILKPEPATIQKETTNL